MKNKHPNAIAVLALGLAMAGLHLAGLLLWTDADTGFATAGSVWLRYIPWLAALALPYLPARRAAAQPAGLQDTCRPLGICMALTGAVLVAAGFSAVNVVIYAAQFPAFFSAGYPVWAAWADFLLPVFCGGWLLYYAVRAFSGFGMQRQRLGRPLLAGIVPLFFLTPSAALLPADPQRRSRPAAGGRAAEGIPCAGAALRPHAVCSGHRGVPALHRAGAAADRV